MSILSPQAFHGLKIEPDPNAVKPLGKVVKKMKTKNTLTNIGDNWFTRHCAKRSENLLWECIHVFSKKIAKENNFGFVSTIFLF